MDRLIDQQAVLLAMLGGTGARMGGSCSPRDTASPLALEARPAPSSPQTPSKASAPGETQPRRMAEAVESSGSPAMVQLFKEWGVATQQVWRGSGCEDRGDEGRRRGRRYSIQEHNICNPMLS